ncbi:uncharacterized protein TNCV_836741 [Trichonephila clavipes]|nr:uncharacterized protein TNCV_836741 [Trichonephila clavipes]
MLTNIQCEPHSSRGTNQVDRRVHPKLFSVSEKILVTSASILGLKSEKSTGSGGTYTQSFMNPTDKRLKASDRVNVEVMRYKLYREALCGQSIGWEIAIAVEHQDRQNQLQLVTSYSLGRPVLFSLQRQPVVSN